jgi:hypothetical protein
LSGYGSGGDSGFGTGGGLGPGGYGPSGREGMGGGGGDSGCLKVVIAFAVMGVLLLLLLIAVNPPHL